MVMSEVRQNMEAAIGKLSPTRARELGSSLMRGEGRDQVARAAQDLFEWSNRNRERFAELVRTELRSQLKQVGLASRDEVDALRKRVRQLEKSQAATRRRPNGHRRSARRLGARRRRRRSQRPRPQPPDLPVTRRRLDAELVRRGLATSRTEAQAAVHDGLVTVAGRRADKPSRLVGADEPVELAAPARRFVSRGGEKLDAALERFGVAVSGRRCLDAGASTGGFTDCLLRRGAERVVAIDVGYGQLAWSLRTDDRVTALERTNVRELTPAHLPYAPDLVVADLSFISLRLAIPALAAVAAPGAQFVLLVKPQFEAGREGVGRGGVVRDLPVWRGAVDGVVDACLANGLGPRAVMASPLPGQAGNVEFPLLAAKGSEARELGLDEALEVGRRIAGIR